MIRASLTPVWGRGVEGQWVWHWLRPPQTCALKNWYPCHRPVFMGQSRFHPLCLPPGPWSLAGFEHLCGCKHRPIGGKLTVGSVMVLVATSLLCGPLSQ